jgi:hypothetical protein
MQWQHNHRITTVGLGLAVSWNPGALGDRHIDAAVVEHQRFLYHLIDIEDDLGFWDVGEKPAHHHGQDPARQCNPGMAEKAPALADVSQLVDHDLTQQFVQPF